jgi:hypothetical protein
VAWSGIRPGNEENHKKHDLDIVLRTARGYRDETADVRSIFSNLLRCNRRVAYEATMIFYRENTFLFSGDWTWETVVEWLVKIGPTNCSLITQIRLRTLCPPHAWESSDGHRSAIAYTLEPPFPRSPYLYRSPDSTAEGIVESINPAIETFFQILKDTPRAAGKLTIRMQLDRSLLPGIEPLRGGMNDPVHNRFTMDLPNIMEKLSEQMSDVEVLWRGSLIDHRFDRARPEIERLWEIVTEEEDAIRICARSRPKVILFVIKRKPTIGLLFAAEPFIS